MTALFPALPARMERSAVAEVCVHPQRTKKLPSATVKMVMWVRPAATSAPSQMERSAVDMVNAPSILVTVAPSASAPRILQVLLAQNPAPRTRTAPSVMAMGLAN